ncbi:MAG: carbohydrate kinase [Lachnospiraceae bacterium]|nr:carbohydrate kinase [Lachnospiraceae bacterium]
MKKLFAIGEVLIDFIPQESGKPISKVGAFMPKVGGAPGNVCGAYVRLGGEAAMITQLGRDPFGDKIVEEYREYGIDTTYIERTESANTSLAFVALQENGNREFSFFRNPGADMLYSKDKIQKEWFKDGFALHFCSVSLGDFPMKEAHQRAIELAREQGMLISFDPNLRFNLWSSKEALKKAVLEFLPMADILKLSDEEVEFITGKSDIEEALADLFAMGVKLVVYTEGAKGARAYLAGGVSAQAASKKVQAVDTTGAGDGFIGAFLYQLSAAGVTAKTLTEVDSQVLTGALAFSNAFCGLSVQKAGAIASYPAYAEVEDTL